MKTPPHKIAKVIALRELGAATSDIAGRMELSERTVKRICSEHGVQKGALLEAARREVRGALMQDVCSEPEVKKLLNGLVNDVFRHGQEARSRLAGAAQKVGTVECLDDYLKLARAESAAAVAVKSNVDSIRGILAFGERLTPPAEDLPVLTIRRLTAQEVADIRAEQREEAQAIGNGAPSDSNDVIELIGPTTDEAPDAA